MKLQYMRLKNHWVIPTADNTEENFSDLEDIATETIKNDTQREKGIFEINRVSLSWGTTLSSLR